MKVKITNQKNKEFGFTLNIQVETIEELCDLYHRLCLDNNQVKTASQDIEVPFPTTDTTIDLYRELLDKVEEYDLFEL